MDVILLGASAIVSTSCVPQYISNNDNYTKSNRNSNIGSPSTIALLLGLALFSLSVLEISPSSWLLILQNDSISQNNNNHDHDELNNPMIDQPSNGLLTIQTAYFILLSCECVLVLILWPSIIGMHLFERIRIVTILTYFVHWCLPQTTKSNNNQRRRQWWLWAAVYHVMRMATILLQWIYSSVLYLFCLIPWGSFRSSCSSGQTTTKDGPKLVLTTMDVEEAQQKENNNKRTLSFLPCNITAPKLLGRRTLGGLVSLISTVLFFRTVGPQVIHTTAGDDHHDILSLAVSWLCALGLLLSSILNGFGSVSLPYTSLAGLYLEPIKQDTITKAQEELTKTEESLQFRKSQLTGDASLMITPKNVLPRRSDGNKTYNSNRRSALTRSNSGDGSSSFRSWLSKGGSAIKSSSSFAEQMGDEIAQQKRSIQEEIDFLQILIEEMRQDIEEMKHSQAMAISARTTMGQIKSWIGIIFSIVLLIKLYGAARSIWFVKEASQKQKQQDPITTALVWLMGHRYVKTQEEYNTLSQFVSLVLTAALTVSQVRNFLRTVALLNRRLKILYQRWFSSPLSSNNNTNRKESSPGTEESPTATTTATTTTIVGYLYPYVLASLMSCYFLACIVLTKMMLPYQYHSEFSAALGSGGVFFKVESSVVNATFALSAIISTAILGLLFGIQRQNTYRHSRFSEIDV